MFYQLPGYILEIRDHVPGYIQKSLDFQLLQVEDRGPCLDLVYGWGKPVRLTEGDHEHTTGVQRNRDASTQTV